MNATNRIKVGDKVRVNGGSVVYTVERFTGNGLVHLVDASEPYSPIQVAPERCKKTIGTGNYRLAALQTECAEALGVEFSYLYGANVYKTLFQIERNGGNVYWGCIQSYVNVDSKFA